MPTPATVEKKPLPQLSELDTEEKISQLLKTPDDQFAEEPAAAKPAEAPAAPADPAAPTYEMSVALSDGRTLNFKDKEEIEKNIKNAQDIIQRFNAERGQIGTLQKQIKDLQAQLQAGPVAAPAKPAAEPKKTREPLKVDPIDFADENAQQKFNDNLARVAAAAEQSLATAATAAEVAELREQLAVVHELKREWENEKSNAAFNAAYDRMTFDVERLQKDPLTQGLLNTTIPFDKINKIVTEHPESAAAMVPEADLKVFDRIMDVLRTYYPVNEHGDPVITAKPSLKSLRAAYAAYSTETGYGVMDVAQAAQAGANRTVEAIQKVANRAPTLPAQTPPAGVGDMSATEAGAFINQYSAEDIKKSPELTERYNKAMQVIQALT
jgi:hypothetical protein